MTTTHHSISRCLVCVYASALCIACGSSTSPSDASSTDGMGGIGGTGGTAAARTSNGGATTSKAKGTGGKIETRQTTAPDDVSNAGGSPSTKSTRAASGNGGSPSTTTRALGGNATQSTSSAGGTLSATSARRSNASTTGAKGGTTSTAGGATTQSANGDAMAIASAVGLGWNLGNSLDAVGGETKWNNPLVTPELIQAVADAGFELVRIPVTWSGHFAGGPEFTIDDTFMKRVEEVIGYVLDRGMYAVVNVHHDGAEGGDGEWLSIRDESGQVTQTHTAAVKSQFVALWKQIATRFKDHSDRLLFESMNEIHVGYAAPTSEYQDFVNSMNQSFVETVRATGGSNTSRCLIVPGYNTNIDHTLAGFKKPTDTVAGKLMLSVHYYDPWDFAGSGATHVWGNASEGHDTWGQEDYVTAQFDKLKTRYVDTGLPVLMGEYGAVQQDGYERYRRYYLEYVTKAAHDRRIIPVIWDNGGAGTGADAFGLFDRKDYTRLHPDVLDAIVRAVTSDYALSDVATP